MKSQRSGGGAEGKSLPRSNRQVPQIIFQSFARLEAALKKKPRSLQINMVGVGEIPADTALLIRSVLMKRSPKTRIITNARNSLQGGSVLVWLLGDQRIIRDDARVFFRRANLSEDETDKPKEIWKSEELKYCDSFSEIEPEENDYARVTLDQITVESNALQRLVRFQHGIPTSTLRMVEIGVAMTQE